MTPSPKSVFHPDLAAARFMPKASFGPISSALMRRARPVAVDSGSGVTVREVVVPGPDGAPDVSLRVFQPEGLDSPAPALLWVHGGGLVIGSPEQDDRTNAAFARDLGITVAAVRYRLAPAHPAPAAVEDAYAALAGIVGLAEELGVDITRIAIGGASAGAGIAAALAILALDRAEFSVAFQLLLYPMIDDRTPDRTDHDTRHVRAWTPRSNRFGWESYVGSARGGDGIPAHWAAARREDLSGLPPAWIGVGTLDLFHDEDVEFARRLREAGVDCDLFIVPGAFHGFDAIFRKAPVSAQFWAEQARALRAGLRI